MEKKKRMSLPDPEILFELRLIRKGKTKFVNWKIHKPSLRRMTEVYGHLNIILEQLREDLRETWEISPGSDGPAGSGKADLKYIG